MKLHDLKRLKEIGSVRLSEWVLGGEHYPEIVIYHDEESGVGYQVFEKQMLYRRTKEVGAGEDAFEYEKEWLKIEK